MLFRSKDVEDLAAKMEMILSMPEQTIRDMGENGRKKMMVEFAEVKIVKRYLEEIS